MVRKDGVDATPAQQIAGKTAGRAALVLVIALLIVAGIVIAGIVPRMRARAELKTTTRDLAVPSVVVMKPKQGAPQTEIVLPGNIQAFADSPIYSRTQGYLKKWYADIGTHVKAGQLLAEIETPEVDQQLGQARADLNTAEANYELAKTTDVRWQRLLATQLVSKQDADERAGDAAAKKAVVRSAAANVARLREMESFKRVLAPFDGVVTQRNTDIGALINAGQSP